MTTYINFFMAPYTHNYMPTVICTTPFRNVPSS